MWLFVWSVKSWERTLFQVYITSTSLAFTGCATSAYPSFTGHSSNNLWNLTKKYQGCCYGNGTKVEWNCLAQINLPHMHTKFLHYCLLQSLKGRCIECGHLTKSLRFHQWPWLVRQFLAKHNIPQVQQPLFPRFCLLWLFPLSKNETPLERN